jgi:hypothetical protein
MSRDLVFWKAGPQLRTTRGAIALGLGEYEIEGLEPLNEVRLLEAIDDRFPAWRGEAIDRWKFECEVQRTWVSLTTFGGTPPEVEAWFVELAQREGLSVFDAEVEGPTTADRRAHRAALAAARRELEADERDEAQQEYLDLLRKAEQGDVAAQLAAGQRLSFGEGVSRDDAAAAHWYERAANAGNVDGMINLAALYRAGRGVRRDPAKAVEWLERALPQDGLFAAFELGQLCAAGEECPPDRERAEQLFQTALANGHPEARRALRLLREKQRG